MKGSSRECERNLDVRKRGGRNAWARPSLTVAILQRADHLLRGCTTPSIKLQQMDTIKHPKTSSYAHNVRVCLSVAAHGLYVRQYMPILPDIRSRPSAPPPHQPLEAVTVVCDTL